MFILPLSMLTNTDSMEVVWLHRNKRLPLDFLLIATEIFWVFLISFYSAMLLASLTTEILEKPLDTLEDIRELTALLRHD